jgi:hypothetical protein
MREEGRERGGRKEGRETEGGRERENERERDICRDGDETQEAVLAKRVGFQHCL